jgi:hypothetical protein
MNTCTYVIAYSLLALGGSYLDRSHLVAGQPHLKRYLRGLRLRSRPSFSLASRAMLLPVEQDREVGNMNVDLTRWQQLGKP